MNASSMSGIERIEKAGEAITGSCPLMGVNDPFATAGIAPKVGISCAAW
jgi:hypothetical protein